MAYYEGYDNFKLAPTVSIDIQSGASQNGYYNPADFHQPPKSAEECTGGLQKTIDISFICDVTGKYDEYVTVAPDAVVDCPFTNHSLYMLAGKVVSVATDEPLVRVGAYVESCAIDMSEWMKSDESSPSHAGAIHDFSIRIKAIDINGDIVDVDYGITAMCTGGGSGAFPAQDAHGRWYAEEYEYEGDNYTIENAKIADGILDLQANHFYGIDITSITINTSIPFFTNEEDLMLYLEEGEMVDPEPTPEGEEVYFYIETNTIMNDEPKTDGATWVNHRRQEFYGINGFKMSRFYVSDVTLPINMKWRASVAQTSPHTQFQHGKQITYNESGGITEEEEYTTISSFVNPWHCGEDWHQAPSGKWYKSDIITNIALVGSEDDDPQPPAPDPAKPNPTGEDDPSTVLPPNTLDAVGGRVYLLDSSAMNNFIDGFFDEDDTIIDELVKGLKMFGSDPTESIIDIYATPINLKTFCNVTNTTAVKVGNYIINGIAGCRVLNNRVLYQLGQVTIRGTYNDWRDLDANYILYLPYVGFINLDTEKYINRTFTIKMATDVHTGNIKYYLFSGGNVLDTYEGCVHMSCPLTNANYHNIPNKLSTGFNSILSATTQVAGAFGGGNPIGLTSLLAGGSGVADFAGTMAGMKDAKTTGNWSSELAVNDCNYPYLIIKQPEYLYPARLVEEFGLPDDSISKLKEHSGYIQVREVNLQTTATKAEIEEIESLLQEGVYI